jgi:L-ascorbate metabolism protein UlaG (beta-lactamase superfamily)
MKSEDTIILQWHGAAHHHIFYKHLTLLIDPLYTRLPGDKPHLQARKEDIDKVDHLLLTHGHLDHSWDFPWLAIRHNPQVYAPEECLLDIRKEQGRSKTPFDDSRYHSLEQIKGSAFHIDDIEITPYQIGTEEIDFWFIRSMFIRPWVHGLPQAIPTGFRWLSHHVFGNCFAFYFQFPAPEKTLLYFGNLTAQVDELAEIERVNVLAIPYCPANKKWIEHSQILINRFKPDVAMIHHFDDFMHPYTLSKYMNLEKYRSAVREKCPESSFYFSKFYEKMNFSEIAAMRR